VIGISKVLLEVEKKSFINQILFILQEVSSEVQFYILKIKCVRIVNSHLISGFLMIIRVKLKLE